MTRREALLEALRIYASSVRSRAAKYPLRPAEQTAPNHREMPGMLSFELAQFPRRLSRRPH